MSRKKVSLAADIDDLLSTSTPTDYDPEDQGYDAASYADGQPEGDEEVDEAWNAPVDVPDGRLRLKGGLHDTFDPEDPASAYAGRKASRSELGSSDEEDDEDDDEEEEEEESEEEEPTQQLRQRKQQQEEEEEEEEEESEEEEDDDDDAEGSEDGSEEDSEEEVEAPAILSSAFSKSRGGAAADEVDDASKGTHIGTQKRLWDSLLQLRMKMQPAMETSRQLPRPAAQMVLRSAAKKRKKSPLAQVSKHAFPITT